MSKGVDMIISIASGKGGTGKTTVATNLALSINENVQFVDCDVEEPNAHIFLKPAIKQTEKAFIAVPEINEETCTYCGTCREVCVYNAIAVFPSRDTDKKGHVLIFPNLCHGCGACSYLCPQQAIKEVDREIGVVEIGYAGTMQFIHGRLNIGEVMSPPLIKHVKKHIDDSKTVIVDAPPGTSCPVVTSLQGSDYCILVTEPTPFGLHDLILAVEVLRKLTIPFGVVINRSDLGNEKTDAYCTQENIPILMKIPFKKEIAVAYSNGELLIEAFPEYKKHFLDLYNQCKQRAKGN